MPTVVLSLKGKPMGRFRVASTRTTIGRGPDNDLVLHNLGISRHHATLIAQDGGFVIQDEGSQNGLFVDGRAVKSAPVTEGTTVQMGKYTLRLIDADDNEHALQADELGPRSGDGPRDPVRTLALSPHELEKVLAGSHPPAEGAEAGAGTLPLLALGVTLALLTVAVVGWLW